MRSSARLVVIDDDPMIHRLVVATLRKLDLSIDAFAGGAEALASMRAAPPDIVLLDYDMPSMSGLEVLDAIKADPILRAVPVVFVTGSADSEIIAKVFERGAADYAHKPFCQAELIARVRSILERQSLLNELTRAARIDTLTGLPNRALLLDRLARAIERSERLPWYNFALLFVDFDRFKLVNDSLGHDMGDALLREIAARLSGMLRPSDSISRDVSGNTLSRLGGDEFVVLLDGIAEPGDATRIAERVLDVMNQPYQISGHRVLSTASVGVVCSGPQYTTAEEMLRDADTAMYEAKARGKARAIMFDPAMQQSVQERVELENEMRDAIGTDQFRLVYQPIVSLEDGRLHGVEALVRWHHPTRGLISPVTFIPIAEETHLVLPLSEWILDHACQQFMRWHREHADRCPAYISVNLSRVQLTESGLVDQVMSTLERAGMKPGQLQLEVTESEIMRNPVAAVELLTALREHGVRLAMDDFGTGYSSLCCLHEFPFDVLKIDRSFINNLVQGRKDFVALVHAVISLAGTLGMRCVAEGIEEHDQLAVLKGMDCEYGQGYLFAKPLDPDHLIEGAWYDTFIDDVRRRVRDAA